MIRATVYIAVCTARNRFRMRLRRLRQPRYLVGAIVGVAYLYLTIFSRRPPRTLARGRRSAAADTAVATALAAVPQLVAAGLLLGAAVAWAMPFPSAILEFSDAETDFLFTAPVTRRQLLIHRLVRSQAGLLFASIVPVIFYPGLSAGGRVRSSIALWLALVTIRVYFTGVTLARRASVSVTGWARRCRLIPAVVLGSAALALLAAMAHAFVVQPAGNIREAATLILQVISAGWPHALVAPFTVLARPLFVPDLTSYFGALAAATLVCIAVCAWVTGMDETFYATATDARSRAESGGATGGTKVVLRRPLWRIGPVGRAEPAFAWRAAVEMVRGAGLLSLVRPAVGFSSLFIAAAIATRQRGAAQLLFVLASVGAGMTIVLGPQMLRIDFRQDLRNIDLLKTWPVRAADVVRGEMLWPSAVLSATAWFALGLVLVTSSGLPVPLSVRISGVAAVAILAPPFIAAQLTIHNAAALAFPAWVATGSQRPRGLDAMGQRLILLAGTLLLLMLMTVPGAAAAAVVWLAFSRLIGPVVLVPSAVACMSVVLVEVLVATEAIGALYERIDLSEIDRAEG